ncbi:MAG: hypothetical protein IJ085_02235 [Turicibacter sp.]|nr:hypothetical protein [Turicibacter sp.]
MSLYSSKNYYFIDSLDFLRARSSTSMTEVTSLTGLVDNSYYVEDNVVTVKSSVGVTGGFVLFVDNTKFGDVVEIEFDYCIVSGDNIRMSFSECENTLTSSSEENTIYTSLESNMWSNFKENLVVANTTFNNNKLFVGLTSASSGIFKLRNLKMKVNRYTSNEREKDFEFFNIKKENGEWKFDNLFFNSKANLQIEGDGLKITLNRVFKLKPVVIVTNSSGMARNFKIQVNTTNRESFIFTFYDTSNSVVDAQNVNDNTSFNCAIFYEI